MANPAVPASEVNAVLSELLRTQLLPGVRKVAGGCEDPTVARVGFMAVPDIGPWLRHGQLLITTPETLARVTETFKAFVGRLSTRGVAALAVQFGADGGDTLAPELVDAAESAGFPLLVFHGACDHPAARDREQTESAQIDAMFGAERLRRLLVDVVMGGGGLPQLTEVIAREMKGAALITTSDGREICRAGGRRGAQASVCLSRRRFHRSSADRHRRGRIGSARVRRSIHRGVRDFRQSHRPRASRVVHR